MCFDVTNRSSYDNILTKVRQRRGLLPPRAASPRGMPTYSLVCPTPCPPQWYPEVNHFCKGVPVLLVGCKTDLRQDPEVLRELRQGRQEPITSQQVGVPPLAGGTSPARGDRMGLSCCHRSPQGEAMARQVHAVSYFECSARYQENVRDIFAATCATALRSTRWPRRRRWTRRGCTLC